MNPAQNPDRMPASSQLPLAYRSAPGQAVKVPIPSNAIMAAVRYDHHVRTHQATDHTGTNGALGRVHGQGHPNEACQEAGS